MERGRSRAAGRGDALDGGPRAGDLRRAPAERALGRPASAGRDRPRAGGEPRHPAHGRALRRPRPADPPPPPGLVPGAAQISRDQRGVRHARHGRSPPAGRSDRRDGSRPARSARYAPRAADGAGHRLRCAADGDTSSSGGAGRGIDRGSRPVVSEQLALLPGYLTAHLQLTLVALGLGAALSIPAGVALTRWKRLEPVVLGVASVIQTIPSLALLAVMVPTIAAASAITARAFGIELRSIGYLPAVIGLTLYSVLPMLRNTVTGIAGVDPAVREAARAVGMTDGQQLVRVEIPLALPVIIAGIRTATVWVVGIATLSTPVGAPSLGNYIFTGLQTRNFTAVLTGCVAAAVLALVLDGIVLAYETGVRDRKRPRLVVASVLLAAVVAYTGASFGFGRADPADRPLVIGAKTFTEQYILSELIGLQITRETGLPTRTLQSLGSTVAFDALVSGELDLYVDYSGTIWATIMGRTSLPRDRETVVEQVGSYLATHHGVTVAARLGFENTYALGMRQDRARALGIRTITDLAPHAPGLEIAGDYEFFGRPEWKAVRDTYGLRFRLRREMDSSLMYQAVKQAEVDVISAFSTDGRIAAFDLQLLEDDRKVIPPYDAIVLIRAATAREHPEVLRALSALDRSIDERQMQRLNLSVDRGGKIPREVAREFLERMPETARRAGET
ncbi:MAG: ABC transporter permease subunit [Deltaproteobacteria bacterium]|nr:ABC transporter permease subunit [Deltaproteobacteria bacterium]